MRLFYLHRLEDKSGISGVRCVAEGVIFQDGKVALRWRTETASSAFYDSIQDVEEIHGHNGKTKIVYGNTQ